MATTDRAFTIVTSPGRIARFVRVAIVPRVLPALFKSTRVRRFMFRTVSQIAINYRSSPLSRGAAGNVKAGDRLPWVPFDGATTGFPDNFVPLQSLDWQLHIYGGCTPKIAERCRQLGLTLQNLPWHPTAQSAGLIKDAHYLVRPDGYIGLADPTSDPSILERYCADQGIRPIGLQ